MSDDLTSVRVELSALRFAVESLQRNLMEVRRPVVDLESRVRQIETRLPEPRIDPRHRRPLGLLLPAMAAARRGWLTTAQLLELADTDDGPIGEQLRAALAPFRGGVDPAKAVGQFLARCADASAAGYRLRSVRTGDGRLHNVEPVGF